MDTREKLPNYRLKLQHENQKPSMGDWPFLLFLTGVDGTVSKLQLIITEKSMVFQRKKIQTP